MFGASFASSMPSSSTSSASAPGGKRRQSSSSSSSAPAPSLPFSGFAAAANGLGGFPTATAGSRGMSSAAATSSSASSSRNAAFNLLSSGSGGGSQSTRQSKRSSTDGFGESAQQQQSKTATTTTTTTTSPPFGGFGGNGGMSPPKGGIGVGGGGKGVTSSFATSAAAAASAASAAKRGGIGGARVPALASRPDTAAEASAIAISANAPSTSNDGNGGDFRRRNDPPSSSSSSVEASCVSPDGRSFHSYLRDPSSGRHAIVSELAPFLGDDAPSVGTPRDDGGNSGASSSSLKITTYLPGIVAESIRIDPVVGLICVDGAHDEGGRQRPPRGDDGGGEPEPPSALPWMCLYTRTAAFLLSIGYRRPHDDDDDGVRRRLEGTILHILEPFERQLLTSPRGSSIVRIRPAPASDSMFQRTGAMAMLVREGGGGGHVLALYHGLPVSIVGSRGGAGRGGDFGGRANPASEGCVTVPLRFDREDLARGMEDTVDAENAAYESSAASSPSPPSPSSSSTAAAARGWVVDFCFVNPALSTSGSGGFAAASVLVLCGDGSVYGASPVVFDGTVMPRSAVANAISRLDVEIEACASLAEETPAPSLDQEQMEARLRQCRAARRYLLDAFGMPEGTPMQGSYYVGASVVHSRSYASSDIGGGRYSRALSWQPRLQGPLVVPSASGDASAVAQSSILPCSCIESFGGASGGGIVDGFVVVRDGHANGTRAMSSESSPIHVEFGILPGEGAVVLPRFEFESDADCRLIDDLVRGAGMYVELATIMDGGSGAEGTGEQRGTPAGAMLASPPSAGRGCAIVIDPLDDIMVHVLTRSRIATVTTNAVAVVANRLKSRMGEGPASRVVENREAPSVRTKVWSCLEVNSGDAALVGARVSGDVHLGHILLARVSTGSMEVVNITAAQCLHETTEQMKAKSEQLDDSHDDDGTLEVLKRVKPLHELLQPLVDKVCDGLSKMGKIVGGATLPRDAGPEDVAVFLETQHSCEVNVLMPMEEMSKILGARRELLKEMYDHQAAELVRLSALLDECNQRYESNMKRVVELEVEASELAQRTSAVLTATRELRPQITDAEAAYFKDLQRFETNCGKWERTTDQLKHDATTSCDAMSAGAIETGDVRCLVDLPTQKTEVCHKLLRGEAQLLKQLERRVSESSAAVQQLSKTIAGIDSMHAVRLRLVGDKENQRQ